MKMWKKLSIGLAMSAAGLAGCDKEVCPECPEIPGEEPEEEPEEPGIEHLPVRFLKPRGISYSPTNYNPNTGQMPSEESVRNDLEVLHNAGFRGIVTYGSKGMLAEIPQIADELGLEYVVMGIWDPEDSEEWNNAINAAPYVDGYCLGNEGLLSNRYSLEYLIEKMHELREETAKPVTTSEPLGLYDDELLEGGDWAFANAHPYWNGINDPLQAAEWTYQQYVTMSSRTDLNVMFKEVGLPTSGDVPDETDQDKYYRRLEELMPENFTYFEAFDQEWKNWAPVEPHWGLFDKDRNPKEAALPKIIHTQVPPLNSYQDLKGRVVNVRPENFRAYTMIQVHGRWWMKPYWTTPFTRIQDSGKWTTDITTGGDDKEATEIRTYLVTPDYSPVRHTLPNLENDKVITSVTAVR